MSPWRRYPGCMFSYYGASTSANAMLLTFYLKRFHHTVVGRVCRDVPSTFFVRGNTSYFAYVAILWARLSAPVAVVASLREPSVLFAVVLGVLVLKEKMTKINVVLNRASPIMETLTGIMIAGLIYYAGQLIFTEELEVNNFFSFLAAMMLAYQPVRSLATLNITVQQGLTGARKVLPIIDEIPEELLKKINDAKIII